MANSNTKCNYTLDLLNVNSVSVKTDTIATIGGKDYTIDTSRKAYANSPIGRQQITAELPEQYANAVFAVWGDTPTIADPELPAESEAN